ncbi:MAG: helix-turn-helix transcriptional regulator, partial [Pseudomonadota bacterium]
EDELHRPLPVLVFVLRFRRPRTDPERTLTNRYNLTGRELETLLALADGLSVEEISDRLEVSVVTVRSHLAKLREKTGCRRAAQLVRLVYEAARPSDAD